MPKPSKHAPRAAYTLHQRDVAPQGFNTLRELYWAIRELPMARYYFVDQNYRNRDDELDLDIRVYEASGNRRPDLENLLNRAYQWPNGDFPWNGDVRPRGNPIMGTGRSHRGHYFRRVRTQSERRLGQPVVEEGEPTVRGKRRPHLIPDAWWDMPQRKWKDRSWKRFRQNQWR